jgi:hypothetical protein
MFSLPIHTKNCDVGLSRALQNNQKVTQIHKEELESIIQLVFMDFTKITIFEN